MASHLPINTAPRDGPLIRFCGIQPAMVRAHSRASVMSVTPGTRKDILKITSWSEDYLRHCEQVAEIADRGGFQLLQDEQQRRREKAERAVVRDLHRMIRAP